MEQPRTDFEFVLLDPRNRAFVSGQSDRIASDSDWTMVAAGVTLGTILGVVFVLSGLGWLGAQLSDHSTNLGNRALIALVTGAGAAFVFHQTLGPLREIAADRRLAREGKIMRGEVTGTEMRRFRQFTVLRVSYTFEDPQGQSLTGTTGISTPSSPAILTRGTLLGILYVNDTLHKAL